MVQEVQAILIKVAIYFRRNCTQWYYGLSLSLLAIALTRIISIIATKEAGPEGLELAWFGAITGMFISVFAGFSFIFLYKHTKQFFKEQERKIGEFAGWLKGVEGRQSSMVVHLAVLNQYGQELIEDRRSNIGIALLAYSALFWQIGATVFLFDQNSGIDDWWIPESLIGELISTLNSGCLLGILHSLRVNPTQLPKWWSNRPVRIFRRYRYILWLTLSLLVIHLLLYLPIWLGWLANDPTSGYALLRQLPDLAFSMVTIFMLTVCLWGLFRERKLQQFNALLFATFGLTLIAQLRDVFDIAGWVIFPEEWNTLLWAMLLLLYKVLLLMILFALSYSWRYHIDKKTISLLSNFKSMVTVQVREKADLAAEKAAMVTEEAVKLREAKIQMNHIVRGSLQYLARSVREIGETIEDQPQLAKKLEERLWLFYDIHDYLHGSEEEVRSLKIGNFLRELLRRFGNSHGFSASQFQIKRELEDFLVLFEYARGIFIVVSELISNSAKALLTIPAKDRQLVVAIRREQDQLLITVTDNGPGYQASEIQTGFGTEVINRIVTQELEGRIQKIEIPKGTQIELSIPVHKISM